MKKKKIKNVVFVIVAHPDDETIAMGATIYKHIDNGDKVFGLYMTNGVGARSNVNDKAIQERNKAAYEASKFLGFKWLDKGDFPDNQMDTVPFLSIVKLIEKNKKLVSPNIVYTHNNTDLNIDHQIVHNAVLTAFRPQPNERMEELRTFEVPSSTDYSTTDSKNIFIPNLFINVSNTWKKKIAALKFYNKELRKKPHSRSIEGITNLAKIRGNQSGQLKCEAFKIIRKVIK